MDFSNFYTIVVIIAVIVLIAALGFLGWTMSQQKTVDEFPKLRTSCPDFWKVESGEGGKVYCVKPVGGRPNSGEANADVMVGASGVVGTKFDTNDEGWASAGNAVCGKQKWANTYGINWDTVTNANFC
jgi:hypothetical protein